MEEYLDEFLLYISSEKGLSINTLEAYQRDLKRFLEHLTIHQVSSLDTINDSCLLNFFSNQRPPDFIMIEIRTEYK